ncbi:MAG: M16 family metallopeptidase [Parvibaculaceae bacterium]
MKSVKLLVLVWSVLIASIAMALPARAFEIKPVTSKSGITAWLVEDHTVPLIAMSFSFRGGAAGDPQGKEGLSHFLSGMLDEGAGDLDSAAFQSAIEENAVKLSYDTERDEFQGDFQTLSANRDAAFRLLRLSLNVPRFDPEPLERIRNQLLLGIREDFEDPENIAAAAWMKTMFGTHPYGRRTKGTEDGIKAVAGEDLKALTKRLFARDGLLVTVVGDIDAETLKLKLDEVFADLPEKSGMPETPEAEVAKGPSVNVIDRNIPQSVIQFGFRGIKRDDPDFMAAYIMNSILGDGGFGSRLTEEVREKRGLSYSVGSDLYPLKRAGLFVGSAATVNARAGETIDILKREIRRMAEEGPTQKELDEARTYLTGSYALRFDSNRKIARQLLAIRRDDLGIDYVEKRNSMVDAVSLEDVKRVARRLLEADLIFTIVGRPDGVAAKGSSG